jgi:hypothetical protein
MSIDQYQKAYAEHEEAKKRIDEFGSFICSVWRSICSNPETFYFTGAGLGVSFQDIRSPGSGTDASKWLSALEINNLIAELRQKKLAMLHEWDRIPADMRHALAPPTRR